MSSYIALFVGQASPWGAFLCTPRSRQSSMDRSGWPDHRSFITVPLAGVAACAWDGLALDMVEVRWGVCARYINGPGPVICLYLAYMMNLARGIGEIWKLAIAMVIVIWPPNHITITPIWAQNGGSRSP